MHGSFATALQCPHSTSYMYKESKHLLGVIGICTASSVSFTQVRDYIHIFTADRMSSLYGIACSQFVIICTRAFWASRHGQRKLNNELVSSVAQNKHFSS